MSFGLYLTMMAQRASPDVQQVVKLSIVCPSPSKPSVTLWTQLRRLFGVNAINY